MSENNNMILCNIPNKSHSSSSTLTALSVTLTLLWLVASCLCPCWHNRNRSFPVLRVFLMTDLSSTTDYTLYLQGLPGHLSHVLMLLKAGVMLLRAWGSVHGTTGYFWKLLLYSYLYLLPGMVGLTLRIYRKKIIYTIIWEKRKHKTKQLFQGGEWPWPQMEWDSCLVRLRDFKGAWLHPLFMCFSNSLETL